MGQLVPLYPAVWMKVSGMSLDLCREFPSVTALNLGGGYKVGRMAYEKSTDLEVVGTPVKKAFEDFAADTGRELQLEIEPGTFLLANSCAIVCSVQDMVETGANGHNFIKLDAGMTEVLRPSLYAAQHPLITVSAAGETPATTEKYVVVGHCCESGDLMTPGPDDAEEIAEREMGKVERGDLLVVEGAGAYCAGMSSKNYNSFPEAPEVMKGTDGALHLIRAKQPLEQIWANEVDLPDAAC
jgi:diaminopimelate decarboxylase